MLRYLRCFIFSLLCSGAFLYFGAPFFLRERVHSSPFVLYNPFAPSVLHFNVLAQSHQDALQYAVESCPKSLRTHLWYAYFMPGSHFHLWSMSELAHRLWYFMRRNFSETTQYDFAQDASRKYVADGRGGSGCAGQQASRSTMGGRTKAAAKSQGGSSGGDKKVTEVKIPVSTDSALVKIVNATMKEVFATMEIVPEGDLHAQLEGSSMEIQDLFLATLVGILMDPADSRGFAVLAQSSRMCTKLWKAYPELGRIIAFHADKKLPKQFVSDFEKLAKDQLPPLCAAKKKELGRKTDAMSYWEYGVYTAKMYLKF